MNHRKALIAPVIITVLLVSWLAVYLVLCVVYPLPWALKLVGVLAMLALCGVSAFVLVERIKEVRSGELDDLDNY